jgi:hypothetical protein
MNKEIVITEKDLLGATQAQSQLEIPVTTPESPLLACSESTAAWLIGQISRGIYPTASETREFFECQWNRTPYFRPMGTAWPLKYANDLAQIPRACRRLRDILWGHEILQPPRPYQLRIDGVIISGRTTVLRSSRSRKHAHLLYLRFRGVRRRPLVPDVVSFARALDIHTRWGDVSREWGIDSYGVLHYWVESDFGEEHRPAIEVARQVVRDAVAAIRTQSALLR